jgi:hypothetical protein
MAYLLIVITGTAKYDKSAHYRAESDKIQHDVPEAMPLLRAVSSSYCR